MVLLGRHNVDQLARSGPLNNFLLEPLKPHATKKHNIYPKDLQDFAQITPKCSRILQGFELPVQKPSQHRINASKKPEGWCLARAVAQAGLVPNPELLLRRVPDRKGPDLMVMFRSCSLRPVCFIKFRQTQVRGQGPAYLQSVHQECGMRSYGAARNMTSVIKLTCVGITLSLSLSMYLSV